MPGMIGLAGGDTSLRERCLDHFSGIWAGTGRIDAFESGRCLFAGHSFTSSAAVFSVGDGAMAAVDGEASLYRPAAVDRDERAKRLFRRADGGIAPTPACKGNLAFTDGPRLHLAAEPSGLFPLYFCHVGDTLLFGSHIRPLAKTTGAEIDPVGICEFARFRHIYGDRSFYKGITRLLPGQVLTRDLERKSTSIRETAETWTRYLDATDVDALVDRYISAMRGAAERCIDASALTGVMMSGGWDSKLLLAAMIDLVGPDRVFGYTHGGLKSRELKIAKRIMADSRIRHRLESIDEKTFLLDTIESDFYRSENAVFPHWMRAGRLLKKEGVSAAAAGIFGEVGGGHYTTAWTMPRWKKGVKVGAQILHLDRMIPGLTKTPAAETAAVYDRFSLQRIDRPRTLSKDFWDSIPDLIDQVNSDIHSHLRRLESRGVTDPDQLAEAILTETRGSQYIGAQLRICRCSLDVVSVYGDMEHLNVSSWIPPSAKVHNLIGREMLRRTAPWLLRYPTAATLISSRYPMILQEAARVARRAYDSGAMALRLKTRGRLSPRLAAWHDFEFLRDGGILRTIAGSYRNSILDRAACSGYIDEVENYIYPFELYNVQNDLMTAFTVDRILA